MANLNPQQFANRTKLVDKVLLAKSSSKEARAMKSYNQSLVARGKNPMEVYTPKKAK